MTDPSEKEITTEDMLEELSLEIRGGISLDTPDRRNHKKILLAIYRFIKNHDRLIVERGGLEKKMEKWKDTADILIKASPSIFISQRCLDLACSIRDFDFGKEGK